MNWEAILNTVVNWATTTGVKVLIAIVLLFVSFKIINFISRKIEKAANKHNADKTIMRTVSYIFKLGAKIIITVCLIGYVGIDTSGITALIASFGVCVGLAVNGALSNLAGGVLIILTRPFRVDDYIEAQGYSGTVEDIHITNTKLRTPDNKIVYIPNGSLSSGPITNYSLQDTRRVDEVFSIAYSADYAKAKEIISDICENHPLVLKDPAPFIRMSEHAASSINVTMRVWTKNADYWTVKFDILEAVKAKFDAEGIEIPFNQMDVHIKND
ncbi:MAG: mechanosensitive ion channel [Clostridia bacterium]|nr:mechanosensitive ion channel [Clostridia bacterium]